MKKTGASFTINWSREHSVSRKEVARGFLISNNQIVSNSKFFNDSERFNVFLGSKSYFLPGGTRGYSDYDHRTPPGWTVAQLEKWPINNYGSGVPMQADYRDWKFETFGSVDVPLALLYDEFRKLPSVTKCLDHHCIDGWSYLGQVWNGLELSVTKEKTRVKDDAHFVLIEGEGLSERFQIDQVLLFGFGQDGAPISKAAGFPLRVIAPGEFGNRSVKWVRRVMFTSEPVVGSRIQMYKDFGIYDLYMAVFSFLC
jgi:DMSO/TMAO reductase YedYZ molybdopterin-dependent catalytic subunit